ncbi:MAG: segregation/condensation protein A [Candidatus Latescibacteria bacterium]|jgi:segregation and condensation protein A|nr:segregation/condensation protein A [Candidatus Latescibacterota bacterium]
MAYQVKLENFDGPLDLLLFLIQENEIDIYDIPVALITGQYLEYIEVLTSLDLEVGGDFLLMAATLVRIKAKMLLPRRLSEEEENLEDPREELVRRLVEYRQFKEAATVLGGHEDTQLDVFFRPVTDNYVDEEASPEDIVEEIKLDLNLWDLIRAFKGVLDREGDELARTIGRESITIEEKMDEIMFQLNSQEGLFFRDLFIGETGRSILVVTFLALLELIRQRQLEVQQSGTLGDIWLVQRGA